MNIEDLPQRYKEVYTEKLLKIFSETSVVARYLLGKCLKVDIIDSRIHQVIGGEDGMLDSRITDISNPEAYYSIIFTVKIADVMFCKSISFSLAEFLSCDEETLIEDRAFANANYLAHVLEKEASVIL